MNLKRQRRPNVRLGEVGDVPAVVSLPYKPREYLVNKRWKLDCKNPNAVGCNPNDGFSSQGNLNFTGFDSSMSADVQHNIENKNPNSWKPGSEFGNSDNIGLAKSELDLGNVTRKCWAMKRRRSSTMGQRYLLGNAWNAKISPDVSTEDGKGYSDTDIKGFKSRVFSDLDPVNDIDANLDREMAATSNEEDDLDETTIDMRLQCNSNEIAHCEGNSSFTQYNSVVYSVRKWLESQGFGKYVDAFEMHEVDEEALPLLTFEDLKELGVLAVGPRRKLYSAIQQLRGGFST